MFNFNPVALFKNWLFGRVLNRHRLIFSFWDGKQFTSADPFVLLRKLTNTDKFDMTADLKSLQIPDPKIISEKIGFIAEGVREIFSLRPFEDGGLSELECVQLLLTFSDFLDRVKKNGGLSQVLLPATETSQTVSGTAEEKSTNENSVCT